MAPWFRLLRIALLPALAWDFLGGGLLLTRTGFSGSFIAPLASLLLLYHAGMVGNDLADREQDQLDRPDRPLPAGQISVQAASLLFLVLLGSGVGLALALQPPARNGLLLLAAIVVVYDFGGRSVRSLIGPPLLAGARGMVVLLGGLVFAGKTPILLIVASLSTAFYFLFLSRLATREERGLPGVSAVVLICSASFSPLLLSSIATEKWLLVLALPLFWGFHILPAWQDRHQHWEPKRVQAAVRRLLQTAPLLPALALLSQGHLFWASFGLLACLLTSLLARSFHPE